MNHTVFHEIAWLLIGAAAVGLLDDALRLPVMVSFIAVGIASWRAVRPSADTASHIRFAPKLGVPLVLFLPGLALDWRLASRAQPVRTRHRAQPGRLHGSRR